MSIAVVADPVSKIQLSTFISIPSYSKPIATQIRPFLNIKLISEFL
jgi:hypothetical protein